MPKSDVSGTEGRPAPRKRRSTAIAQAAAEAAEWLQAPPAATQATDPVEPAVEPAVGDVAEPAAEPAVGDVAEPPPGEASGPTPEAGASKPPEGVGRGRSGIRWWMPVGAVVAASGIVAGVVLSGGAEQTGPKAANALLVQGLAAQRAGNLGAAATDYQAAIRADARNVSARYDLGTVEQARGDTAAAIADYQAALRLNPKLVPALYNLGILFTPTDPARAATLYREAIAVDPNNPGPHLNLGFLLKQMGQSAEGDQEIATAQALQHGGTTATTGG